jgi:PPM family protein phosphatase
MAAARAMGATETGRGRKAPRWDIDGHAIIGARKLQEDCFDFGPLAAPDGQHWLLIVADGMGGHAAGEHASATAVRAFRAAFEETAGSVAQRLEAALHRANEGIARAVAEQPDFAGMGCTLVAAHVSPRGLSWISVGDSPLWLWRGGRLRRLNEDHSMRALLRDEVARGRLAPDEAENHPDRNALLSAVAGEEMARIDLSPAPLPLQEGDLVLLATDGLLTLEESQIAGTIRAAPPRSEQVVRALLGAVERRAARRQENCTVLTALWPRRDRLAPLRSLFAIARRGRP